MDAMGELLAADITAAVRESVATLVDHLGAHQVVAVDGWKPIAVACGLSPRANDGEAEVPGRALLVVGPIASYLPPRLGSVFGFVTPGVVRRKIWQRKPTRFVDPTMALWRNGWSPTKVDRIEVATADATVELVIGVARQTPSAIQPSTI